MLSAFNGAAPSRAVGAAGNTDVGGPNREEHIMNITYRNPLIKQLRDQHVRVTSRDKKLEHVNRAERLLAEVDPSRSYPYDYLCYRITEYRPDSAAGVAVPGKE